MRYIVFDEVVLDVGPEKALDNGDYAAIYDSLEQMAEECDEQDGPVYAFETDAEGFGCTPTYVGRLEKIRDDLGIEY